MPTSRTVWGIDIGQCALKALKLRDVGGELEVEAFDIIEHPKILSQPDADRPQLIRNALDQFLAQNNVSGSVMVVSVPGQSSFTRFVKLPPVESRRVPDIVRFEAEQQIPFPIVEVIWRWQTFDDPDSPDVEVGIFAMKRVDVAEMLGHFEAAGLDVDVVQMAPLALYNFMTFDEQLAEDSGATLLADIGADKTDLVVADGARIWTRTIHIGGNNFTSALERAFKLKFPKAEKLKRMAASNKYARQIFQAMRPVFADLVQEVQRSIGYYTSLHRETRFRRLVGLGNGFRLPGLQKFLEQNLNIPVVRIDSYNRLRPSPTVNAPTFTENVLSFAVAYGLALQGLEQTRVGTNLLPAEVARRRAWARKRWWFAAAAAVLLVALALPTYRSNADRGVLRANEQMLARAQGIVDDMQDLKKQYIQLEGKGDDVLEKIKQRARLFEHRDFWPAVQTLISQSFEKVQAATGDQGLLRDYMTASNDKEREAALEAIKAKPRAQRRMMIIKKVETELFADIYNRDAVKLEEGPSEWEGRRAGEAQLPGAAAAGAGAAGRGFRIFVVGHTPLPPGEVNDILPKIENLGRTIAEEHEAIQIIQTARDFKPAMGRPSGGVRKIPDPIIDDEEMTHDTLFYVGWAVAVVDGVEVKTPIDAARTEGN